MFRSFINRRWISVACLATVAGILLAAGPALASTPAQTDPRPAPRDCGAACDERAKTYYEKCFAEHGDAEGCRARADKVREDCLTRCEKPADPRPPSISPRVPRDRDCAGACNERAKNFYNTCVEEHGDEAGCSGRARAHLAACLTSCDKPADPKPIDCDVTCRRHAEEVLKKCEAAGGDNCSARAREAHAACMTRCERPADVRPIDCGTECSRRARAMHQRCTESGGADCGARARTALAECTAGCERPGVRPAPGRPIEPGEPPVSPRPRP